MALVDSEKFNLLKELKDAQNELNSLNNPFSVRRKYDYGAGLNSYKVAFHTVSLLLLVLVVILLIWLVAKENKR